MAKTKIIIVEDNRGIRDELSEIVFVNSNLLLLHAFENGDSFLQNIQDYAPDVVLMDINMPGTNGIECIRQIKSSRPEVHFLVCTVYEDHQHIFESLCAGATGYILKSSDALKIYNAIDEIQLGGSPMSALVARLVVNSFNAKEIKLQEELQKLSIREKEILDLMAKGFKNKEIAELLFIGNETVKSHVKKIYEKLQLNSRKEILNFMKK
ncbi:MAG: response regulator [Flavobacteriales bacterium]